MEELYGMCILSNLSSAHHKVAIFLLLHQPPPSARLKLCLCLSSCLQRTTIFIITALSALSKSTLLNQIYRQCWTTSRVTRCTLFFCEIYWYKYLDIWEGYIYYRCLYVSENLLTKSWWFMKHWNALQHFYSHLLQITGTAVAVFWSSYTWYRQAAMSHEGIREG